MTIPYRARLLLDIDGASIELARFSRRINPHDIAYWGADREDRLIIEQSLTDKQTITARHRPYNKAAQMRLNREFAL